MKKLILSVLILLSGHLVAQVSADRSAMLKSAILPGWGEYALHSPKAKYFLTTDLSLLASYFGLKTYASDQTDEMELYATQYAGAAAFSSNSQYWVDLGAYLTYDEHKSEMLESRTPEKIYNEMYAWDWDTIDHANTYRNIRRSRDLAVNRATLVAGAMVMNRIVSVLDVVYLSNHGASLSVNSGVNGELASFRLSFDLIK